MNLLGRLSSLAVMLFCAAALVGGWMHIDWLPLRRHATLPMGTSTALCLALAGAVLSIHDDTQRTWRLARIVLAASVILIASTSLLAAWTTPGSQFAVILREGSSVNGDADALGMAPQAAVAMLSIAIVALLSGARPALRRHVLMHGLLIVIFMVGGSGLIGHAADLSVLYRWPRHPGIDPLTAASLVLLAFSASIAWRGRQADDSPHPMQLGKGPRIMLFNLLWAGLFCIGITGVAAFARTVETMHIATLEHIVRMQSRALREELEAADIATDSIAGRPYLISQLKLVNQGLATDSTIDSIRRAIESIVLSNVDAMAIYALNGTLVARRGAAERPCDFDLALDHTHRLLWHGAPVVRRTIQMVSEGQLVATAVVDVKLPNVRYLMKDAYGLGPSAETALCGTYDAATVLCMPQRHRAVVSRIDRVAGGRTLPIGLALDGQRGTTEATDYRRQAVIASYAPIADYPLGIVTKVDRSDLSAPIQHHFGRLVAGLIALLIVSLLATHLYPRRAPVLRPTHPGTAS